MRPLLFKNLAFHGVSENPEKPVNIFKSDMLPNLNLISLDDLFMNLGIKMEIHNDGENAVYFEVLNQ